MKKDKWLKWKLGAIASAGIALLFQEVKASSAFKTAADNEALNNRNLVAQTRQQDPIMDNATLNNVFNDNTADYSSNTSSGHANDKRRNPRKARINGYEKYNGRAMMTQQQASKSSPPTGL